MHPPTEHACRHGPRPAGGGETEGLARQWVGELHRGGGVGGGRERSFVDNQEVTEGRASGREGSLGSLGSRFTEWGPDLKLLASAFREQFGHLFQVQEEGVGEQTQTKSSLGPGAEGREREKERERGFMGCGWQDLAAAARRAACALIREEFVILSRLALQHPETCELRARPRLTT
jgi:hypothetical protein